MEKKKLIKSIVFPTFLILIIWFIKFYEVLFQNDLSFLGIYPLHLKGLWGIITAPLVHSNFNHLYANTIPLYVLCIALFYFYYSAGYRIFLSIYLTTNLWVWLLARPSWHLGASGLIYGLASFIFVSGIIRKNNNLLALSLFVIFLYGGMIWGIFPNNIQQNISWESHLMGLIAGVVYAFYYKNSGPQKTKYQWEEDDDNDDEANNETDFEINNFENSTSKN